MLISTECTVTAKQLALLGIYDDVYATYENINNIYECAINNNISPTYGECTWGSFRLNEYCMPQVKKELNKFYKDHLSVFTEDYARLYVNSETVKGCWFYWCDMKIIKGRYEYTYKPLTFKNFILLLEKLAAMMVYQRKQKEHGPANLDDIIDKMNIRIKYSESKTWHEHKIECDKRKLPCSEVILYKSLNNISCVKKQHVLTKDDCIVPLTGNNSNGIKLPIHKCETCGKQFIGLITYKVFIDEYGIFLCEHFTDEASSDDDYLAFASESKLHRMGYNVADGVYSEHQRHAILIELLENKWMSYLEICRDIENAIHIFRNKKRFEVAVDKWCKDLKFISEYTTKSTGETL